MGSCWAQIRARRAARSSWTRTVKRSTTLHPTFTAVGPGQPPIRKTRRRSFRRSWSCTVWSGRLSILVMLSEGKRACNAVANVVMCGQWCRQNTSTQSRVVTAMTLLKRMLFQYQGHVSAALVLGGVDVTGPHLYTIYPHGRYERQTVVSVLLGAQFVNGWILQYGQTAVCDHGLGEFSGHVGVRARLQG